MHSIGLSPLHSPRTMMQLNSPQLSTAQASGFTHSPISPMQISPPEFPTKQPLPSRMQPRTFQPPAPIPPQFQTSASFTMPAPKTVHRQNQGVDPHYNPNLDLLPFGIDKTKTGFVGNIEELSKANRNFRTVLYTTDKLQLVLMSLNAGQEIGLEVHPNTDQFFRIETGKGIVEIDGVRRQYVDGTAIQVPRGSQHNLIARTETKLYTIYSPPHH